LLVVLVNDLDRQAAELAAVMVKPELERVAHVVADGGGRAAECADEADLHCLLLGHRRPRDKRERGGGCDSSPDHCVHPSDCRTCRCGGVFLIIKAGLSREPLI
jgi:hypothetical protein